MFSVVLYGKPTFVRLDVTSVETEVGRRIGRVDVYDEDGIYGRLSVAMPHEPALPTPDHFWLKDWSENRELATQLLASGYIELDSTIPPVSSGYVEVKAAKLV